MAKEIGVFDSKTFDLLKCPVARKVYALFQTIEDIKVERMRHASRARHFGETESSLGGTCWSFLEAAKRRKKEERDILKDLKICSQICPLWTFVRQDLNLAELTWSFLISRCSPFKFYSVNGIISLLGNSHNVKLKDGTVVKRQFKTRDGKIFNKIRRTMIMRKTQPYQKIVEEMMPLLQKKHPDYTPNHIKNLAWYKVSFDKIIVPFFKRAQVECHRCSYREGR